MYNTTLKTWLLTKGYCSPNEHVKRFTHLCMDGGKLYIPLQSINEFWKMYAEGLNRGEEFYICESPKYLNESVRRFYCDFDFKELKEIDLEYMKKIVRLLNEVVNSYFGVELSIILCSTTCKEIIEEKNEEKQKLIKSGYHCIWPDLYLTETVSIQLCQILMDFLNEKESEFTWNKILDLGVYKTGLRMIGSYKIIKIKNTKKRTKEYRRYTPVYKYPEDAEYFDGNYVKYLCDCSIQNVFGAKSFPSIKPIGKNETFDEREVLNELNLYDAIRSYIRKYLPKEWDEEILDVTKKSTWYFVRTKSRHCANIGGEHNSENIYFQIYTHGFVQKCFCRCDTLVGRKDGLCKNFQSKKYPLSEKLFKILFPGKIQKTKEKLSIEKNENMFLPNTKLSKKSMPSYLQMSLNTIKSIEKKCL